MVKDLQILIAVVVVMVTLASDTDDQDCGLNAHFSDCTVGCVRTCENYGKRCPPDDDAYHCVPGCVCHYGYTRNNHNECIEIKDCPGSKYIHTYLH